MDAEDRERLVRRIAIDVHGGRPDRCAGWKAKMFNAAWAGAEKGVEAGYAAAVAEFAESTGLSGSEQARKLVVQVLSARLPLAPAEKRPPLLQRIAAIKSGQLDTCPEVSAALLALASLNPSISDRQG